MFFYIFKVLLLSNLRKKYHLIRNKPYLLPEDVSFHPLLLNQINTAVGRYTSMPEVRRILIDILEQSTHCTSVRRNKDCFVSQCRICCFPIQNSLVRFRISEIFSPFSGLLKFSGVFEKDLHFAACDYLSLRIFKLSSFQNSEVNLLDPLIFDHRKLPVSKYTLCCLPCPCQRTG